MKLITLLMLLAAAGETDLASEDDAAAKGKNKASAAALVTPEEKPALPEKPPLDVSKMPFTRDSIKQVVEHSLDKIQACYEETLADMEKPAEGKLMTSFVVTGEGLVKRAKVEWKGTTLKSAKLNACVVDVLNTLTFPKTPDGRDRRMEYPFNLKAVR